MTTFRQDKEFTEQARLLLERDLYPVLSWQGRWVSLVGAGAGVGYLQRAAHIDAVVQTGPGTSITVEEKIVRQRYSAFAVETHSNVEKGGDADGWIFTSTADLLIYAFRVQEGLECWLMSLPALRRWFVSRQYDFAVREVRNYVRGEVAYHSRCRLVPTVAVGHLATMRLLRW